MNEILKKEVDIRDLINVLRIYKFVFIIFVSLCFSLVLFYYYFFNKDYNVTIKYTSIDNENFQIIESVNQNLNILPPIIKNQFIFHEWEYQKFHNYYAQLILRRTFFEEALSEYKKDYKDELINLDEIIDDFQNLKLRNGGTFISIETVTKYPNAFFDLIFKANENINLYLQKTINENSKVVFQMKENALERLRLKNFEDQQKVFNKLKEATEIKIIMLKKQLEMGLVNDDQSLYDDVSFNFFNMFTTPMIENLSESQILKQIEFYETLSKNDLFFDLDYTKFISSDCDACASAEINNFFKDYNINVADKLSKLKVGNISEENYDSVFVTPWKLSTLLQYIFLPFVFLYFILLIRYIYFSKSE